MRDLQWLLGDLDKSAFYQDTWQRRADKLSSGAPDRFASLFSMAAVERVIEFGHPRPPAIRLASAGVEKAPEIPMAANGSILIDQLRKHYRDGCTVILNSVEDFDPEVAQFARALETEMGARVQVNCYLTPRSAQGFKAHYDTHDVLVAQIQGEKHWRVYGGDAVCPLNALVNGDPRVADMTSATPWDVYMRAGDVLYIPRGWIHEAVTDNQSSLHLTFGVHPPLLKDLLNAALESLVDSHAVLREALPPGPLGQAEKRTALQKRLASALALFVEHASVLDAAALIDNELLKRGRSGGDGALFADMDALPGLNPDSLLERRRNVACRVIRLDDQVGLQFLTGLIKGPAELEPAMQFVRESCAPFRIGALPGLTAAQQLIFARSLVSDGLCRLGRQV